MKLAFRQHRLFLGRLCVPLSPCFLVEDALRYIEFPHPEGAEQQAPAHCTRMRLHSVPLCRARQRSWHPLISNARASSDRCLGRSGLPLEVRRGVEHIEHLCRAAGTNTCCMLHLQICSTASTSMANQGDLPCEVMSEPQQSTVASAACFAETRVIMFALQLQQLVKLQFGRAERSVWQGGLVGAVADAWRPYVAIAGSRSTSGAARLALVV